MINKVLGILVKLYYIIGFLIIIGCVLCIVPFIFMLFWNYIMPIFDIQKITFIQSLIIIWGINFLTFIIKQNFKNYG